MKNRGLKRLKGKDGWFPTKKNKSHQKRWSFWALLESLASFEGDFRPIILAVKLIIFRLITLVKGRRKELLGKSPPLAKIIL